MAGSVWLLISSKFLCSKEQEGWNNLRGSKLCQISKLCQLSCLDELSLKEKMLKHCICKLFTPGTIIGFFVRLICYILWLSLHCVARRCINCTVWHRTHSAEMEAMHCIDLRCGSDPVPRQNNGPFCLISTIMIL